MRTTATPQRSAQPSRFSAEARLKAFRPLWASSSPTKVPRERRWHRGWPLFLAIVVLAAAPLFNRTLGQVAVGVLFALMLWTALRVRRRPEVDYGTWGTTPERRGVKGGGRA